jgi:nucleoside-diphosphate-sugar epimerase
VVPLPGGGRSLVQPIHQGDVTASVLAALRREWRGPHSLVIAGPDAMPYAGFVRAVAAAGGLGSPRILPVPAALLMAAAAFTRLPGLPRIRRAEIQRLLEDKAFDVTPMRVELGVHPIGLPQGLALTFA